MINNEYNLNIKTLMKFWDSIIKIQFLFQMVYVLQSNSNKKVSL